MTPELLIDDREFLVPLYGPVQKFDPGQRRDRHGRWTEQATVTVGDRSITVVKPARAVAAGDKLVPINVIAFDTEFQREEGFYLGVGGEGGIGNRYERFGDYIGTHDSIEAPEVTVHENGRVGFTNGRHRYAWLRDQGLTSIPVSMTPESVRNAKRHEMLAAVKRAWDESQHPRDEKGEFTPKKIVALFAEGKAPDGDQVLADVDAHGFGYSETKFILPSGKRLAHGFDTHAAAAHALGVDLDDAMMAGIIRYTPGTGAEIGGPMTKAQAQHLVDATIQSGGNNPLFVDVFHGKVRDAKVFDTDRATAATVRNWVNSHFTDEAQKWDEADHPRDDKGQFIDSPRGALESESPKTLRHSEEELQALAQEFEAVYGKDAQEMLGYVKTQALFAIGEARHHSRHAASIKDEVKTADEMDYYLFDKVVPLLKEVGWPKFQQAKDLAHVFHQYQMSLLPRGTQKWDESQHPRDAEGQFTDVPVEPGTTPIPPGKIRGYHYTENMDAVEQEGLDVSKAHGAGYGEPNAIWFSTAKPSEGKDYVEVFLDPSDIAMGAGPLRAREDPTSPEALAKIEDYNKGDHDFMVYSRGIPPDRFVSTHRPWHDHYRYFAENPETATAVLAGEFDDLLDDPDHGPAIRKFKEKHVQKSEHSYGNTQIQIDPASSAAASLNAARATIADADCMADGKDVDPNHVTVRYGLENEDLDGLRAYLSTLAPFEARVLRVELFPASEHSDGAVPVVALIASHELRQIEQEIGKHADFKEKSFPVYKPHCTLAYCKPEKAEPYADLYVDGSFVVSAIIISHKDHRQEIVHLGTAVQKKDPVSGRYVTPFVSFDKQGDESLRMIASLNSSRLATWGFTAEAEVLGMARYKLTAILDGRTSRFCRLINGKVFNVPDARRKVIEVLEVQDPNDLKVVQPWPKQTKAALAEFAQMSAAELTERGLHIPPYHPHCRTICRAIQSSAGESTEVIPTVPAEAEAFHAVTAEDLKELGIDATPEQVDQWNEHVGMTPVELLSKLSGLPPQEVMTKGQGVGANPIRFEESGNIGFNVRGSSPQGIEFKLGALLDPFTGTYYLTRADLEAGNPKAELSFLKQMFSALIDMGLKSTATEVAVGVAGNAAYYARLGFLPDELEWDSLRTHALTIAEPMLASLQPGDRLLVEHLLQDTSVGALSTLVELPFTYEGVTIGEWLFGEAVGTWGLDLTNELLVAQAKGYLS